MSYDNSDRGVESVDFVSNKEFKTAVDAFFFVWPILVLATQIIFLATSVGYSNTIMVFVISLVSLLITSVLMSITTTRYVINQNKLLVKNLFFGKEIPISDIIHWEESKSSINMFAASNKQVKIITKNCNVNISPLQREEFMQILKIYKEYAA